MKKNKKKFTIIMGSILCFCLPSDGEVKGELNVLFQSAVTHGSFFFMQIKNFNFKISCYFYNLKGLFSRLIQNLFGNWAENVTLFAKLRGDYR